MATTSFEPDLEAARGDSATARKDPEIKGCYYICDMKKKRVFWLEKVPADIFWDDLDHRIVGKAHLGELEINSGIFRVAED